MLLHRDIRASRQDVEDHGKVPRAVAFRYPAPTRYPNPDGARRGLLEVGTLADPAILSDNPLAVDPGAISKIHVRETIEEGVTVSAVATDASFSPLHGRNR